MTDNATKPIVVELGIEFVVELLLFLYPFGAEQMGLPHNFWLGLGCWVVGTVIGVRMFWIFPIWTHKLSRLEKGLISVILVGALILIFREPVTLAYYRYERETEAKAQPTEQLPVIKTAPEQPPPENEPTVKPIPGAKPIKGPIGHSDRVQTSLSTRVPVSQSCPNGICIGGENTGSATVNNFGPSLPNVRWSLEDKPPQKDAKHPQVWVKISIDRTFMDPKFAVVCDRPCKGVSGNSISPFGGTFVSATATIPDRPDVAAFVVSSPNPMPAENNYLACVESMDDNPVRIVAVATLTIKPKQQQ